MPHTILLRPMCMGHTRFHAFELYTEPLAPGAKCACREWRYGDTEYWQEKIQPLAHLLRDPGTS